MVDTTHYASDTNIEGKYIPKANQFERDMDSPINLLEERYDKLVFEENSNIVYNADNVDEMMTTEEGAKEFWEILNNFFYSQKDRLEILNKYAEGQNVTINAGKRRLENDKADYRIAHNFVGYICDLSTDFVLSKEVTIDYDGTVEEAENDLADVAEINKLNDINTLNYELGYDAAVFGRAIEYHYREPNNNNDYIVRLDPREAFVIRDKTVKQQVIAGVSCPVYNGKIELKVYTKNSIYEFEPFSINAKKVKIKEVKKNPYNDIPFIEWWNNRYRKGDAESELDSIDAYDAAQSDTANYMSDLNDAMLVLSGDVNFDKEKIRDMKEVNVIALETGMTTNGGQTTADAKYIYKQYDVAGTEAYKDRLLNMIHLLSRVPKIDDENFGNQSGIAMMYKLFGFKQLGAKKARYFSKALKERYSLIQKMRELNGGEKIDANSLLFTFHENLPQNVWEEIKQYIEVGGEISQKTLREHTSFTNNADETIRIEEEDNARMQISPEKLSLMKNNLIEDANTMLSDFTE